MTPEEQLPLLLDAFRALAKPPPQPHMFIAGGLTHPIAAWRIEADAFVRSGDLHGQVLHALLDAVQHSEVEELRQQLLQEREKVAVLQATARRVCARITKVMKVAVAKKQTHIYQTLKEARDDLREELDNRSKVP